MRRLQCTRAAVVTRHRRPAAGGRADPRPVRRAGAAAAVRPPAGSSSADLSGRPSPTSAAHVGKDLGSADGGVSGVVDSRQCRVGLESSVVQVVEEEGPGAEEMRLRNLSPGTVTRVQLQAALPHAVVEDAAADGSSSTSSSSLPSATPLAPGMKYAHYQPRAPFVLLQCVRTLCK